MAIGMPVIVSNTVAYRETVGNVGLDWLCVDSPGETGSVVNRLEDVGVRKMISDKFVEYAYDNHSPEKSGKILAKVFEKC